MVYQGYRGGAAFSKGDPTFSRDWGGPARVQLLISYNYITFYFPGEGLPLFPNPI